MRELEEPIRSARPVDFANASPFHATKKRDRARTVLFVAAAIALLAWLVSMLSVLGIHPPAL